MTLLTAEEAVELSGFESALALIDVEMRDQASKALRFLHLKHHCESGGIPESQLDDVFESLRKRGFKVERLINPTRNVVSW